MKNSENKGKETKINGFFFYVVLIVIIVMSGGGVGTGGAWCSVGEEGLVVIWWKEVVVMW